MAVEPSSVGQEPSTISLDQIYSTPMSGRMREVLSYFAGQRDLFARYLDIVREVHRADGFEMDPNQALQYPIRVLEGFDHTRVTPLVADFSPTSHRKVMTKLIGLGNELSDKGASSGNILAGRAGTIVHNFIESRYRGDELPGKTNPIETYSSEILGPGFAQMTFEDCVDAKGSVREDFMRSIDTCRQQVAVALDSTGGNWDAMHYGTQLYELLRPLMGDSVDAIYKHRHTNPNLVASTLVNLATMLIFTQTPEYQESRMPAFTEIRVLFDSSFRWRADALVITGKNGEPLNAIDRAIVESYVHDPKFRRKHTTTASVLHTLSQILGGDVEGVILDFKHEFGDNHAKERYKPIDGDEISQGPLQPHVDQVTSYLVMTNLEYAMRDGTLTDAKDFPQTGRAKEARLLYVTHHNLVKPTEHVIAPTLTEQEDHFEKHIVQQMPTVLRQAQLRAMLEVLVDDIVGKWKMLQGVTHQAVFSVQQPDIKQPSLFPEGPTFAEVVEAHRKFLDPEHRVEVIGKNKDGSDRLLLHLGAVRAEIQQRFDAGEMVLDRLDIKGGTICCPHPEHDDSTPSAKIDLEKRQWICYGCHRWGFVEVGEEGELEKIQGVRRLGGKGMRELSQDLSELAPSPEHAAIMGFAQDLFRQKFESRSGKAAKEYLKSRGISLDTAREFGVGYCNFTYDEFLAAFANQGFTREQLETHGLIAKSKIPGSEDEYYLTLNKRLTFPLALQNNITTSFYGRAISPKAKLKHYLPSVKYTSVPYHGMGHQKVLENNPTTVTVTEGMFDAMARYEMGDRNVIPIIATSNDILIQLIARKTQNVNLAMDWDDNESGQKGTKRLRDRLDAMYFRRDGGHIHDLTHIHMRRHPQDLQYKDWNLIWQAHPGMQAEIIS